MENEAQRKWHWKISTWRQTSTHPAALFYYFPFNLNPIFNMKSSTYISEVLAHHRPVQQYRNPLWFWIWLLPLETKTEIIFSPASKNCDWPTMSKGYYLKIWHSPEPKPRPFLFFAFSFNLWMLSGERQLKSESNIVLPILLQLRALVFKGRFNTMDNITNA